MPIYVAFLRAINLGARRKFSPADVRAATEAAGATDVETHINTGNVLLTSRRRSTEAVAAALEEAYRADRGFEVPTVVLTPDELCRIADDAAELAQGAAASYVSLLKAEPTADALAALEEQARTAGAQERLVVRGRAAHLVLSEPEAYHRTRYSTAFVERHLGVSTNRNRRVIQAIVDKWGPRWGHGDGDGGGDGAAES